MPNMRFETGLSYHNSTSSLKNHLSSVSSTPIVYCWCKKNKLLLSTMLISNLHDKNVHLICLENTVNTAVIKFNLFKLFVN